MADKIIGAKSKAVPVEKPNIGIDLDDTFQEDVLDAIETSTLNTSVLDSFSQVAQTREEIYKAVDTMTQDSKISAILDTYTDYVCETNDSGRIVWCESDNEQVAKYVTYLLDSLNVDKHSYAWVRSFITNGDLYWRLHRESEYKKDQDILFGEDKKEDTSRRLNESVEDLIFSKESEEEIEKTKEDLKESIYLNINDKSDHYIHYIEAVPNPGEMFELTKFGKSMAYIKAPVDVQSNYDPIDVLNSYITYNMNKGDVEVYSPTEFAHACYKPSVSRNPEEVKIFISEDDLTNNNPSGTFSVRRGQSMLYNKFKVWRELTLLENSLLLNRLTKSAIVRIVQSEVKNMPKEQVVTHIQRLKGKIEQKSAIDTDKGFMNYTNPGPIENIIYVPTRDGQGNLTFTTLGGDVDVKSISDIEYFENDLYGSFGIPKQYFGRTNDSTGFNGGTSLSIISSKFGKDVKSIQNDYLQGLTDVINMFLLDKGLTSYVNNFTLRMQEPVTQEYKDRQEASQTRVGVVRDLLDNINEVITDDTLKAKAYKQLLSTTTVGPEVLAIIQDQIDLLEKNEEDQTTNDENENEDETMERSRPPRPSSFETSEPIPSLEAEQELENSTPEVNTEEGGEEILPSADELGIDLTNSENI